MNCEKVTTGSFAVRGGLALVCVSCGSETVSVVFKMFSRYPRSTLRHELSHSTRVATFKVGGSPMPGNDAGSGPPGGAAHQGSGASGEVMAAARSSRSRTPRGRSPKYASVTEFRANCGEGVVVERAQGTAQAHPNPLLMWPALTGGISLQHVLAPQAGGRTGEDH